MSQWRGRRWWNSSSLQPQPACVFIWGIHQAAEDMWCEPYRRKTSGGSVGGGHHCLALLQGVSVELGTRKLWWFATCGSISRYPGRGQPREHERYSFYMFLQVCGEYWVEWCGVSVMVNLGGDLGCRWLFSIFLLYICGTKWIRYKFVQNEFITKMNSISSYKMKMLHICICNKIMFILDVSPSLATFSDSFIQL